MTRPAGADSDGTRGNGWRFSVMGVFRDPLVLLLVATAAAIAFYVVVTLG